MKKPITLTIGVILMASALMLSSSAKAQVDTIRLKDKRLITSALKPGLKQYLVYMQSPTRTKTLTLWFWMRDIKTGTRNGEKVFNISQHWYGPDSAMYRTVYSVNRASDFAPIYHAENVRGKNRAYNWSAEKIVGADTVADNTNKTFNLVFQQPAFNWNLDIETFEMLPLAAGKTFAINFHDSGSSPDKFVNYKVTGSEVVALLDNTKVDCWILVTEGKAPNGTPYSQSFWIGKKSHELIKEEDDFGGGYRYKVKLPAAAPDLIKRFK